MRNQILRFGILVLLLAVACNSDEELTGPRSSETQQPDSPSFVISDAAHLGTEGFYFLPPMVPDPGSTGVFDASFLDFTKIRICELGNEGCVEPPLMEFASTADAGTLGLHIPDGADHYLVNWHTDEFELDTDKLYRIQVQVGDLVIGYADVNPVRTGNELKNVDTGEFIALKDGRTLPIKFTVNSELAGLRVVGSSGGTIEGPNGRALLRIPAGALGDATLISIAQEDAAEVIGGTSLRFEPSGLSFAKTAQLQLCYEEGELPAGTAELLLGIVHSTDGITWTPLPSQVDGSVDCIQASIVGFSQYAMMLEGLRRSGVHVGIPWALLEFERRPDNGLPTWDWAPTSSFFDPWGVQFDFRNDVGASGLNTYIHNNSWIAAVSDPIRHSIVGGFEASTTPPNGNVLPGTTIFRFDPAPDIVYFEVTERADALHYDENFNESESGLPIRVNESRLASTPGRLWPGTVVRSSYESRSGTLYVTRAYEVELLAIGERISSIEIFGENLFSEEASHVHYVDNVTTLIAPSCGTYGFEILPFVNAERRMVDENYLVLDDRLVAAAAMFRPEPEEPSGMHHASESPALQSALTQAGYPFTGDELVIWDRDIGVRLGVDEALREAVRQPGLEHFGIKYHSNAYQGQVLVLGAADEQLGTEKAAIPGWSGCTS